jgi:o-succinylbenzoate synthase
LANFLYLGKMLKFDRVEIREIALPLVHFFETSFGRTTVRRILLVRLFGQGIIGVGECTAGEGPFYSYETTDTAWQILRDFLVPMLWERRVEHASEVAALFRRVRGHPMAKAALETAAWDWEAKCLAIPLYRLLGGTRKKIGCGVSIGIQDSPEQLLEKIAREIAAGYQRIKVKIKPGWDVEILAKIRDRFPLIRLMADANSAYTLADAEHLKGLDQFELMMIEQPLHYADLVDHGHLQQQLKTPICLDESILQAEDVRKALALGSGRIINVKLGRVGGYSEVLKIHALARERQVPLWCGGMLESGIGRAHNIALSSLEGFVLPGDVSASRRYYAKDIIEPQVEVDPEGFILVPEEPGIGYQPNWDYVDTLTTRRMEFAPSPEYFKS